MQCKKGNTSSQLLGGYLETLRTTAAAAAVAAAECLTSLLNCQKGGVWHAEAFSWQYLMSSSAYASETPVPRVQSTT